MRAPRRYTDVADALATEIGAASANSIFPTEEQLARRFAVSRGTVRRALDLIERAGLVTRRPGRGTIVNPPKILRHLSPLHSLDEDLRQQGIKVETRVLDYQVAVSAPSFARDWLRLRGHSVGVLALLRLVEDRVICHDRHYFPPDIARRFDPLLLGGRSVPEVLREATGRPVTRVDWETEIVPSSPDVAVVLGITPGVMVVANTRIDYLANGFPVHASVMYYRIDRVKFRFTVHHPRSSASPHEASGDRERRKPRRRQGGERQ